jgi:Na+/H+ antiporter NhaD/arsenite permease-like protein
MAVFELAWVKSTARLTTKKESEEAMKGKKIMPQVIAASAVTIAAYVLRQFYQIEPPAEVGAAVAGLLAVLVSVATPDNMEADE